MIKREEPIIQSSHDYQPKTKNQEREEKDTITSYYEFKNQNTRQRESRTPACNNYKKIIMPFSLCLLYK